MKRIIYCLFSLLAVLACTKQVDPVKTTGETATVVVNVFEGALSTKADAYLEQQTYEKQINNVQILVFDEAGRLNAYKNAGTAVSDIALTTTTGAKQIWAVVNGPDVSGIAHLDRLKAIEVALGDNSIVASKGFIMVGSTNYTVSNANTSPASITVSRLLSRIALRSVTNATPVAYGNMVIVNAYLQNVVGNLTLGNGNADELVWLNKMGRDADGSTIDGVTASADDPTLTFCDLNETVASGTSYSPDVPDFFYCYKNNATTYSTSTTWSARKTAMTIAVKFPAVDSEIRYYTVVLPDKRTGTISQNTAYTVDVTVTGLGSTDPTTPVEKGDFNAAITVAEWSTGAVLDENL